MQAVDKLAIKLKDADLAQLLCDAGYTTPGAIRKASDKELLAVKGIGPAKLGKLARMRRKAEKVK